MFLGAEALGIIVHHVYVHVVMVDCVSSFSFFFFFLFDLLISISSSRFCFTTLFFILIRFYFFTFVLTRKPALVFFRLPSVVVVSLFCTRGGACFVFFPPMDQLSDSPTDRRTDERTDGMTLDRRTDGH